MLRWWRIIFFPFLRTIKTETRNNNCDDVSRCERDKYCFAALYVHCAYYYFVCALLFIVIAIDLIFSSFFFFVLGICVSPFVAKNE